MSVLLPFVAAFAALIVPLTAWQVGSAAMERAGR